MLKRYGKFAKDGIVTILDASHDTVNLPNSDDLFLTNLVPVDDLEIKQKYGEFVGFVTSAQIPSLDEVNVVQDKDTILQFREKG